MAAAAGKYVTEEVPEDVQRDALKVPVEAYRRCVRNLQQHKILSAEWLQLIDSIQQLAKWAQLEVHIPANAKVSEVMGRINDGAGTLWDQEKSENAIRVLVEEAKVNLCIRMMTDFKTWQYDEARRAADVSDAVQRLGLAEAVVEGKCVMFEEALGLLMARSFAHVETLQLTDIPLLIEYCMVVLEGAKRVDMGFQGRQKLQEVVVLQYFSAMMRHAEALNKPELLAKTREFGLVGIAADHALRQPEQLPLEVHVTLAQSLAGLADNEDFATEWQEFFTGGLSPQRDQMLRFLELESKVVAPVLAEDARLKQVLRPLLDLFRKIERALK